MDTQTAVAIMARYPAAGGAKTRLANAMGATGAAEFYRQCASQIFSEMSNLPEWIRKYLFYTGAGLGDFQEWVGDGYLFRKQKGQTLGDRLINAFDIMFKDGIRRAVIIASDVPDVSASLVTTSLEVLEAYDVVLGPSHDGGYYLIGLPGLNKKLFKDIEWGSCKVLQQTIHRIEAAGLNKHMLPTLIDIDTIEDYQLWQSSRSQRVTANGGR